MSRKLNFETFKYFLECYFNVSADYDELDKIIKDFNLVENMEYRKKLRTELKQILRLENWDMVQRFVKKYGMRKMNEEKLKWLIQSVLDNLELN
ncbi:contact-dependent growth inhibition system immunity protein [Bacillus sp. UNC437CL72CviS29]|uniref:contact-dependent growth inhibition system immunity protein n=1 Tax=Bacillus sp. UNC437CL72CviS29 TaxID=1340430 RepID=UPI0004795FCA|nr:contact-dependent growth inhibition system immunity protein [Bacillus sp. UNC437CL72CviS29]